MITNQDIICISSTTWHGPYTKSTVQLLSRLSRNNRILFVEYPFTLKDVFTTVINKQRAPLKRMLGFEKRLVREEMPGGGFVYILNVPPVIPFDFSPDPVFRVLNRLSVIIYRNSVLRAAKELDFKDPIVINAFNPFYGLPLLGIFKEKLNLYYCYDGTDTRKHGQRAYEIEKMFCQKADGIIVTSDHLLSLRKPYNSNSLVVKNGVEFELFNSFFSLPVEAAPKVRIGYVGSVDDRFNIQVVLHCVKSRPDWQFEFTGDIRNKAAFDTLRGLANVTFRNSVGPREVPGVMAGLSAGIIPYSMDEANRNIYPLKINEYLAMGIPVVMTDFATLPEFEGLVSVAADEDAFLKALEKEVSTDSEAKRSLRVSAAKANSWDERTKIFSESIEELLKRKMKVDQLSINVK